MRAKLDDGSFIYRYADRGNLGVPKAKKAKRGTKGGTDAVENGREEGDDEDNQVGANDLDQDQVGQDNVDSALDSRTTPTPIRLQLNLVRDQSTLSRRLLRRLGQSAVVPPDNGIFTQDDIDRFRIDPTDPHCLPDVAAMMDDKTILAKIADRKHALTRALCTIAVWRYRDPESGKFPPPLPVKEQDLTAEQDREMYDNLRIKPHPSELLILEIDPEIEFFDSRFGIIFARQPTDHRCQNIEGFKPGEITLELIREINDATQKTIDECTAEGVGVCTNMGYRLPNSLRN